MEKKEALEKKICPIDGTSLGAMNGKIICENEDCDFISDFAEVKELLGHNPYAVEIKLISRKCREDFLAFHEGYGVVGADSHEWKEKERFVAEIEVLKCEACEKESIGWERRDPRIPENQDIFQDGVNFGRKLQKAEDETTNPQN